MVPLSSEPFNAVPPLGSTDAFGWQRYTGANLTIAPDPTAPASQPNVMTMTWPTTLSGGSGPFNTVYHIAGTAARRLYLHFRIWVDPNWTNGGNTGTKLLFFSQHDGTNHYVNFIAGASGTGPMFGVNLQNAANRNMPTSFYASSANKGRWLDTEIHLLANTATVANGIAQVWVDGHLALNISNALFFQAGQVGKEYFNLVKLNPTYGGGSNHPPRNLVCKMDHLYVSSKAS